MINWSDPVVCQDVQVALHFIKDDDIRDMVDNIANHDLFKSVENIQKYCRMIQDQLIRFSREKVMSNIYDEFGSATHYL